MIVDYRPCIIQYFVFYNCIYQALVKSKKIAQNAFSDHGFTLVTPNITKLQKLITVAICFSHHACIFRSSHYELVRYFCSTDTKCSSSVKINY